MKKLTILIVIKLFIFTFLLNSGQIKLPTINLDSITIENKYKLEDRYQKPKELPSRNKKESNNSINLDIDVNKEQKQIDSFKLDIGKKF